MKTIALALIGLVGAPVLGGLIAGLDRKLSAKIQSRIGPPLLQPFYDLGKLFGKERLLVSVWQSFCAWIYVSAAAVSVVLFFMQSDLLYIFFIQAVGSVFLVIGALAVPSPFSQVGAQRELLQILAYEPLLILVIVGVFLTTGSFKISAALAHETPLLFELPLLFLALGYALTIKLRKSPFDVSSSHHAHQEIVRGVLTEYSGPTLALLEIAHWYEVVLVLGLISLFWATSWTGMAVLLLVVYAAEILVDNATSRMTWRWMLGRVWAAGLALSCLNLIWLYAG